MHQFRFGFAGDRAIAASVLDYLLSHGYEPSVLVVAGDRASHGAVLRDMCSGLPDDAVIRTKLSADHCALFSSLRLNLLLCIHYPYIIPDEIIGLPKLRVLNLHPAYLPYNRGWHTASWALLEGTPIGATLHEIDAGIDTGPVVHRRQLVPDAGETADMLYRRLFELEQQVFEEAWPEIVQGTARYAAQDHAQATCHKRRDLHQPAVQAIDLSETVQAGAFLRKLRALTTNRLDEAAYFDSEGHRYRVRVNISREEIPPQ